MLSVVIRFALSRQREYLADAGSVELTKNPDAMISALRKIESRGELHHATSAVMEMCVDNPREGFANIFATHPSVEARVAAIMQIRRRPRSRPAGDRAAEEQPQRPINRPTAPPAALGRRAATPAPQQGPWGPEPGPPPSGPWGPNALA